MEERNADRLKLSHPLALKQVLGESVLRRDDFLHQRQMGNLRQGEQVIPQPGGKVAAQARAVRRASRQPPKAAAPGAGSPRHGPGLACNWAEVWFFNRIGIRVFHFT